MKRFAFSLVLISSVIGCSKPGPSVGNAETRNSREVGTTSSHENKKDNTAINDRDRSNEAKTPLDQNQNQADIDITASIRKRVVDTKMSMYAHNSKIITQDGKVTLRGPVKSEEERKQLEEIATAVAGPGNVDNQLEVQP